MLFYLFFSRNPKRTNIDESVSLFTLTEKNWLTKTIFTWKIYFSSVYVIGTTCFNEYLITACFYSLWYMSFSLWKFIVTLRFFLQIPSCGFLYFMLSPQVLIPEFQNKAGYRGWILHPVWYLNFRYPAANLKLSAEDLDIRPGVWVWIWGLVNKSSAEVLGIRYPAEGFIKSGP